MKKILTLLLSLSIVCAIGQQRIGTPKVFNHEPGVCPSLVTTPVDNVTTFPADLVEAILGADIQSYSNVSFTGLAGTNATAGLFTGGTDAGIGIEDGIMLSSGYISYAIGPNAGSSTTAGDLSGGTGLGLPGDAQLTALAGFNTFDATALQFDFVPNFDNLFIEFVFGSEEYNEWVGDVYNDVFSFNLNGTNIALVPATNLPVTIHNINLTTNNIYYKNNEAFPGPFCNEMDGFTTVLVATGAVNPNVTNTIKLSIADGADGIYDSWVFIKADSFGGDDPGVPISDWALYIGILLILTFAVIRFRKLV